MSVEILFTTHNRLAFTEASLAALRANTNWGLVARLQICDDESVDGTYEFLADAIRDWPAPVTLTRKGYGGSVNALAEVASRVHTELFAKIDNDVIVCSRWLETMIAVLTANQWVDALGMEPGFGAPLGSAYSHTPVAARWIGGVGVFRSQLFKRARLKQNDRFFGLTAFWRHFARCAWISPDLPVFLLDKLPFEPWRSLTAEYVERGWSREWPEDLVYPEDMRPYWSWWLKEQAEISAA